MNDLAIMIEAGKILARQGFKDDEIELVKRFARESPATGHSPASTLLLVAKTVQENPASKSGILEYAACSKEHRELEGQLLAAFFPILHRYAEFQAKGDLAAREDLIGEMMVVIKRTFPNEDPIALDMAFADAWKEVGWGIDCRALVRRLTASKAS